MKQKPGPKKKSYEERKHSITTYHTGEVINRKTKISMNVKNLLSYIFNFKIEDPNYFNWQCTKSWQIRLFYAIYINRQEFKRQITKNPHANKAWLSINIFGLRLNFRIGLQHHTWL